MNKKIFYGAAALAVLLIFAFDFAPTGQVDDWQYSQTDQTLATVASEAGSMAASPVYGHTFRSLGTSLATGPGMAAIPVYLATQSSITAMSAQANRLESASGKLGYAAGGSKDINNFRDNIDEGYLPLPTDLSYEGLFYEYYFDRGQEQECNQLFCPSYSTAISEHPLDGEKENYMTVGLNSNMDQNEFERKKLNVVVVMDVSGSMSSSFDQYYYDRFGNEHEVENYTGNSKIEVARESMKGVTQHLRPGDRFGVVLFNNDAKKAKPLRDVSRTDMEAIRNHMNEIRADGGTNMEAGMDRATEMLSEYQDADQEEYENRIIFLTDAMPNMGTYSDEGLLQKMEDNAQNDIHTSFIGIGVDFDTETVDNITSVKGANYFSVHSSEQFRNRMDRDFKYMVTPLVYNLSLRMESDTMDIEKVYGSTAAEESTGELLKVNTLFPSPTKGEETRGGVVLAEVDGEGSATLEASYETRTGETESMTREVSFDEEPEHFENTGVRKAVLLAKYGEVMKEWARSERQGINDTPTYEPDEPGLPRYSGTEQERTSVPIKASEEHRERISEFRDYFKTEMERIGDDSLQKEVELMNEVLEKTE
jgi:Ca-activated chloride channel family protein